MKDCKVYFYVHGPCSNCNSCLFLDNEMVPYDTRLGRIVNIDFSKDKDDYLLSLVLNAINSRCKNFGRIRKAASKELAERRKDANHK